MGEAYEEETSFVGLGWDEREVGLNIGLGLLGPILHFGQLAKHG
jgi:hypothetical protein